MQYQQQQNQPNYYYQQPNQQQPYQQQPNQQQPYQQQYPQQGYYYNQPPQNNGWGQQQQQNYIYQDQPQQNSNRVSQPKKQEYKPPPQVHQPVRGNPNSNRSGEKKKFKWSAKNPDQGDVHLSLEDRRPFIRKVYCIILSQLAFTVLMCIISYTSIGFRNFQLAVWPLVWVCIIICIAIEIVIFCYPKQSWIVPRNYILLSIYTFCMSYIVSHLCSYVFYTHGEAGGYAVLMAAGLTLIIVIALTIYAVQTKVDFTTKGQYLFMASIALLFFGIFAIIFMSKAMLLLYSLLCCLLFGAYLVYDTQLIVGGKVNQ